MQVTETKANTSVMTRHLSSLLFYKESMSYNEGGWTLVTRRRSCKKQESHPYPNLPRNEQCKQNIHQHTKKKEEKKPKRKQAIV